MPVSRAVLRMYGVGSAVDLARLPLWSGTLEGLAMRLGATAEEPREGRAERGAAAPLAAGDLRLLGPDHAKLRPEPSAPGIEPGDDDAEERR